MIMEETHRDAMKTCVEYQRLADDNFFSRPYFQMCSDMWLEVANVFHRATAQPIAIVDVDDDQCAKCNHSSAAHAPECQAKHLESWVQCPCPYFMKSWPDGENT